jgi:hypothetical protein
MTSHSRDKDRDASWQVFEALRTAPEPIRRSAREAIEAGNQETFISLVTEYLQTPTSGHSQPRIAPEVLNRVDWDWLAGEFLAGPYPSDVEPPPPHPRP